MSNELILDLLYYGGFAVMIIGCVLWNRLNMPLKVLGMIIAVIGGASAIISNKILFSDNTTMNMLTILVVIGSLLAALFIYHPQNSKK